MLPEVNAELEKWAEAPYYGPLKPALDGLKDQYRVRIRWEWVKYHEAGYRYGIASFMRKIVNDVLVKQHDSNAVSFDDGS